MSRGATALKARGLYKNIEREVLMTVVTRKEISELTELIENIDPDAFVIISDVHEVLGEGFRRRIWKMLRIYVTSQNGKNLLMQK